MQADCELWRARAAGTGPAALEALAPAEVEAAVEAAEAAAEEESAALLLCRGQASVAANEAGAATTAFGPQAETPTRGHQLGATH